MHIMEQLDIHLFGATASFSLLSAFISLLRSIIAVAFLWIFAYFVYLFNPNSTQNLPFSAFVAFTISTAYIMSRYFLDFINLIFF